MYSLMIMYRKILDEGEKRREAETKGAEIGVM
jgi:hypothetical protein